MSACVCSIMIRALAPNDSLNVGAMVLHHHRRCLSIVVGWLVGWLGGWLVGWLVGWLTGWLVGWCMYVCMYE